jgi:hypothetical protein
LGPVAPTAAATPASPRARFAARPRRAGHARCHRCRSRRTRLDASERLCSSSAPALDALGPTRDRARSIAARIQLRCANSVAQPACGRTTPRVR